MLKSFAFLYAAFLSLAPNALAADKTLAYLVPGIATAPEGLYQVAAYRTARGESDGSDHYGYHFVKLTNAGSLEIASPELPIYASEAMDIRGYGLTRAQWSVDYLESQIKFSGIAILNVDTRRGNFKVIYELQNGRFEKSKFDSDALLEQAQSALSKELNKDPAMKDAFIYLAGYFHDLRMASAPVGENISGNTFDMEEGLVGDFSVSFYVTPKNSEEPIEFTVSNSINFKRVNGKLQHSLGGFSVRRGE